MDYKLWGRTGLRVSQLGFGCGNIGGLLIRGDHSEGIRAVARAVELGVNYFDTAPSYGDGESETNLGSALKSVGTHVYVGTKVRLAAETTTAIRKTIISSVEGSLSRLGREYVDLVQLHNSIVVSQQGGQGSLSVDDVVDQVVPAFQALQNQGEARFWGVTGFGETEALHEVVDTGAVYTVQTCYNLLNPSAGQAVRPGFSFQDFGGLIDRARDREMGVIAIRVLAAGALSGVEERHRVASATAAPMGSGRDYHEDVMGAKRFEVLVGDGHVDNLIEAAVRFAISKEGVSTELVGFSSLNQVNLACEYTSKGPLPTEALRLIAET